MAKKRKKKEEVDVSSLDPDQEALALMAYHTLGTQMASIGGKLTAEAKSGAEKLYKLLRAGRSPSAKSDVLASIGREETRGKKYTPADAIKLFQTQYPLESQHLTKLLEETVDPSPTIEYGLKPGRKLDDSYCEQILQRTLGIPQSDARALYHGVIKPAMERAKKKKDIVSKVM